MESARLSPDGHLHSPEGIPFASALPVLSHALALDGRCTLRSFFRLLDRHPELLQLSAFLAPALAEAGTCPASGCRSDDISALVIGRTMELIGFPGRPRAELYLWLRGLDAATDGGPTDAAAADKTATKGAATDDAAADTPDALARLMGANRELRFVPLQVLLDTPLFLSGLKHVVLGDVDRSLVCASRFTLFEIVDGLAWEFGFRGGSQQCSIGR